MKARLLRWFFLGALALFLAAPLVIVAGVSVNEKQSLEFPPQGFSLAWYLEIFTNPEWRNALWASLGLATCSAALAVAVAFPLAWFGWRRIAPGRGCCNCWVWPPLCCRRSSLRWAF